MPRRLTIVRHAKSDWGDFAVADHDRPLNERGLRDAPAMGLKMRERGDSPDLIVCSSALRAHTTASLLANALDYPEEDLVIEPSIYEAPTSALLEVVRQASEEVKHLMMVGHNPGSEQFASFLLGEPVGNLVTCSVVDLELVAAYWKSVRGGEGKLISYWYPKMFSV